MASKLERAGIRFSDPLPSERPEVLATKLTQLEDPWKVYPALSIDDVVWISAFSTNYSESRFFIDTYCQSHGIDSRLLKRALSYANSGLGRFDPHYARLVIANYKLISNVSQNDSSRICPHLRANPSGSLTDEQLTRYGIRWLMVGENKNSGYPDAIWNPRADHFELYMDAPLGFVLTYKNLDNAISTFWAENADTLMIHQIQGIRRRKLSGFMPVGRFHSVGLNLIDFRKMIIDFLSEIASQAGFVNLAIKGARNNSWTGTDDDGNPHMTIQRAFEVYDGTAQRLGFSYDRNGNWYKQL